MQRPYPQAQSLPTLLGRRAHARQARPRSTGAPTLATFCRAPWLFPAAPIASLADRASPDCYVCLTGPASSAAHRCFLFQLATSCPPKRGEGELVELVTAAARVTMQVHATVACHVDPEDPRVAKSTAGRIAWLPGLAHTRCESCEGSWCAGTNRPRPGTHDCFRMCFRANATQNTSPFVVSSSARPRLARQPKTDTPTSQS